MSDFVKVYNRTEWIRKDTITHINVRFDNYMYWVEAGEFTVCRSKELDEVRRFLYATFGINYD